MHEKKITKKVDFFSPSLFLSFSLPFSFFRILFIMDTSEETPKRTLPLRRAASKPVDYRILHRGTPVRQGRSAKTPSREVTPSIETHFTSHHTETEPEPEQINENIQTDIPSEVPSDVLPYRSVITHPLSPLGISRRSAIATMNGATALAGGLYHSAINLGSAVQEMVSPISNRVHQLRRTGYRPPGFSTPGKNLPTPRMKSIFADFSPTRSSLLKSQSRNRSKSPPPVRNITGRSSSPSLLSGPHKTGKSRSPSPGKSSSSSSPLRHSSRRSSPRHSHENDRDTTPNVDYPVITTTNVDDTIFFGDGDNTDEDLDAETPPVSFTSAGASILGTPKKAWKALKALTPMRVPTPRSSRHNLLASLRRAPESNVNHSGETQDGKSSLPI